MENEELLDIAEQVESMAEGLDDIKDWLGDWLQDFEEEAQEAASCDNEDVPLDPYKQMQELYSSIEAAYKNLNRALDILDEFDEAIDVAE